MNSRLLSAGCVCWLIVSHASFGTEEPRLSIANSRDEIVLSWPIAASNWVLESSSALPSAVVSVSAVPPPYETNGPSRQVRVALATIKSGNRFYRLRRLVPPVEGLTGHWQLDEGAGETGRDATGGGTALFTTGTSWGAGKFGTGALQFLGDGISRAWVSNENSGVLPTAGGPFSLSLWFNLDAVPSGSTALAGNDTTGISGWRVTLNTPGTGTNFITFSSAGPVASLSVTGRVLLLPGQWHQLTVTYDGTEGSIYLDSEMLGRASGQISPQSGPIYLGGGVAGAASFLGRIDDVRTYTNCLTHEQISLAGHWRFDENGGTFAADSSIQGHYASVTETTAWVPGHSGTGIDLSCGQVVIENREQAVLPATGGPFSVSVWLRPGELQNGTYGLMHSSSGGTNGWQLTVEADASSAKQLHWLSANLGGTLDLRAPATMAPGLWTKVDLTFNGGIATLYADGGKVASGSGAIRASQAPLVLGAVPGTSNFNGVVDDLKIYSRERGEGEVGPYAPVMWETVLRNTSTNITISGSGPPGRPLTYSIVPLITPTNGTVTIANGAASFTYSAGVRKGPDAFTYTVSDGEFTSPPAVVTMSVVEPHWLSGSGGGEPRDGSNPARAWPAGTADAVDAIWRTNNYYDCFFYAQGVYETRGCKLAERSTANPGCKHIGAASSGPAQTTIRLVDVWSAWAEEAIFAPSSFGKTTDNFEIHDMVLDCNATNVPKYVKGEPVWIRIPLATPERVESITLRWGQRSVLGNVNILRSIGSALEFSVDALRLSADGYITNHLTATRTGQVDTVMIGTVADELVVRLERRAPGVDIYGLAEVEVTGATVSLPTAKVTGGAISQLDGQHDFLQATDDDRSTWWASGPESEVQLDLPLAPGTRVSDVRFNWNCRSIAGSGQAGPAAGYSIQARDELSGQWFGVPLTRQWGNAAGEEIAVFGTDQFPTNIVTDHLVIVLTNKEAGVDFYSLREVTPRYAGRAVDLRQPSGLNYLSWAGEQFPVRQAFDRNPGTLWASGTQGMVGAVNVSGSNLKFTRLKVIGFGTRAIRECFPMFICPGFEADRPQLGNVTVDECVFTDPAPVNQDGVTVVVVAGNAFVPMTNAIVRRCSVSGLRPHFATTQATTATHLENCTISDCVLGVYFEPERGVQEIIGPILVRSNLFYNVDSGVYALMHSATRIGEITMLANEVVLTPRLGWGLAVCDACYPGPSGTVTNITALNNLVRYTDWTLRPSNNEGGFSYSDIQHAVFGNNTILLGGSNDLGIRNCPAGWVQTPGVPEDCEHPVAIPPGPPTAVTCLETLVAGYKRAWFNNRNSSGGLSPIRIHKDGLFRPAEPQQWPD